MISISAVAKAFRSARWSSLWSGMPLLDEIHFLRNTIGVLFFYYPYDNYIPRITFHFTD